MFHIKNNKHIKKFCIYVLCFILMFSSVSIYTTSAAQTVKQRIAKNVKRADIVIAGSSSAYYWKDAKKHLGTNKITNLGVGGTKVEHWQQYHSYITKCKPKIIILYIGGNNIRTKNINGITVSKKIIKLLKTISAKNPKAKIYICSIHPNQKRWAAWTQTKRCNNAVKKWCKNQKKIDFIDITNYCLKNGKPDKSLFKTDRLHFNSKGYDRIFKNVIAKKIKNNGD